MVNSLRVSMECPQSPFQLANLPIGVNSHFLDAFCLFVSEVWT